MVFQPGQSGNPLGRPKGTRNKRKVLAEELENLVVQLPDVQGKTNAEKLLSHAVTMAGDDVSMMKWLLAHVYGNPVQAVDIEAKVGPIRNPFEEMTVEELRQSIAALQAGDGEPDADGGSEEVTD